MRKRLQVTPARCTGCRTCELACAFSHPSGEEGSGRSRVSVIPVAKESYIPLLCLQCEDAACVRSCKVGALERNPLTGAIEVIEEKCVRCLACVAACPFGNMIKGDGGLAVYKCDLCGGRPRCAMFCPSKALEYVPIKLPARLAACAGNKES